MNNLTKIGAILLGGGVLGIALSNLGIEFISKLLGLFPMLAILAGFVILVSGLQQWRREKNLAQFTRGEAPFAHVFLASDNDSGIAYDPHGDRVRLRANHKGVIATREYKLADVREYRTALHSGGEVYAIGGSMHQVAQAQGINRQNRRRNEAASGLFVKVRDVNYPEWRIQMLDNDTQNTWGEILNQAFEGAGKG